MYRRLLAVMAVAAGAVLMAVGTVAAQSTDPSATREFDTGSVAAGGGPVVATITVSGATQAVVTETLPTGFDYVSSSLPDSQVRPDPNDGQRIRFVLADSADNPFTYTVTVSQAGAISGKLTVDRIEYDVTGDDMVTVRTAPSGGGGGGGGGVTPANRAPVFSEGASAARSVAENSAAGTAVGRRVTATDPDGDRVTYSLVGGDTELFNIDSATGQISVAQGTALDFETKSSYAVTARAADRRNSSDTIALTITVTNVGHDDAYDANDDGVIGPIEVLNAVEDYFSDPKGNRSSIGGASRVTVRVVAPAPEPEPQVNRAPVFSAGNSTTRSVDENSASGANVGAWVTASDPDGDGLTYTLAGTDDSSFNAGSFGIVAATGQIQVGDGTNLDYEGEKNTYGVEVTATDPSGASDMITVTITVTNVEEMGEVTLWAGMDALTMAPQVSDTITGAVMDPDGGVMGESWQWSRTMGAADMNSWMPISGATDAAYMVTEGDTGYHLRVMATYTDAAGTDMGYSPATMMVGAMAEDPLLAEYANEDGEIEKADMRKAVRKFFADPPQLSRSDMRRLVAICFR